MSVPTLKDFLTEQMRQSVRLFLDDLEAMPDEMLARSPGGCARTPLDLTFEVAYVNERVTARLTGRDPGAWSPMPWTKAPADFSSKAQAIARLKGSADALLAAWEAFPEADLKKPIQTATGQTDALDVASLAAMHMMYHDAQLNYIQTLSDDAEMHWKFE